jgi:hypothetical protein
MKFDQINEDETYKIRQTGGGHTFGTVTGKSYDEGSREEIITWESDHPEAEGSHWCRPEQVVCKVADGTYLGDNGRPIR